MTDKKAMQMALETLDNMVKVDWREWDEFASVEDFVRWAKSRASFTAEALRARLSQPEPEPVAWHHIDCEGECIACRIERDVLAAYGSKGLNYLLRNVTALPQREWVGLTDDEIAILWKATPLLVGVYSYTDIAREVEAKLKEKNT